MQVREKQLLEQSLSTQQLRQQIEELKLFEHKYHEFDQQNHNMQVEISRISQLHNEKHS